MLFYTTKHITPGLLVASDWQTWSSLKNNSRVIFMQNILKTLKSSRGSYIIEATIIMPVIMIILFMLIFFAMFIYQKYILMDTAVYVARQAAATWNNSDKDFHTGGVNNNNIRKYNDGLYWRVFKDGSFTNSLPSGKLQQDKVAKLMETVDRKLSAGLYKVRDSEIVINYKEGFLLNTQRKITVTITQDIIIPFAWVRDIVNEEVTVSATAVVGEPVEHIRNVNLIEKYVQEAVDFTEGKIKELLTQQLEKYLDIFAPKDSKKPEEKKPEEKKPEEKKPVAL